MERKTTTQAHFIITLASLVLAGMIVCSTFLTNDALAVQNNVSNTTSCTPIDMTNVIKQSEQRVNDKLSEVRDMIQANNTSQAVQAMDEVQQEFQTFVGCVTASNYQKDALE